MDPVGVPEEAERSLFVHRLALTVVTMALLALAVFFVRRRWRWLGDAAVTGGGLQHSRRVAGAAVSLFLFSSSRRTGAGVSWDVSHAIRRRFQRVGCERGRSCRAPSSNASTSTPWLYVHPSSPSPRGRVRLRTIESVEEFEAYMAASMQQQSSTSISEEGSSPSPGRRAAPPGMARASTIE